LLVKSFLHHLALPYSLCCSWHCPPTLFISIN